MMGILEEIIAYKRKETEDRKKLYPSELLKKSVYHASPCVSLKQYILRPDKLGVIAEFKRKSPSKGMINQYAEVEKISIGYMQAGASALSVLTDEHFFGGNNVDLKTARKFNYCPVLRKDFIIDEYQIEEAKSIGADAILLIAAILTKEEIGRFTQKAHDLGMEVLLEFYKEEELEKYDPEVDLVGINNRNLQDFSVQFDRAINLANQLPEGTVKIAESGIQKPEDILVLKEAGFDGFLIGTLFMQEVAPEQACRKFIHEVQMLTRSDG
ncbi:MAG: indole-3-glycerol phosphate synthase TrpC [Bacteroidales bacterium]|nr:indole-3-glycerol phosphate synthase TrpC [Bacteroidales bacterium]